MDNKAVARDGLQPRENGAVGQKGNEMTSYVFHRGFGFLAMPMMAVMYPVVLLVNKLLGENYAAAHLWPGSLGLCVAGILTFCLGRWLNKRSAPPPEQRPKGLRAVYDAPHMFAFMRMEYWGFFYILFGIVILFAGR